MAGIPALDAPTLLHVARLLEDRLQAVVTYGAGGCRSCHDAELRGAIVAIKKLAGLPSDRVPVSTDAHRTPPKRRRPY
jgi:cytochrome c553